MRKLLFAVLLVVILIPTNYAQANTEYIDSWGNYVPGLITNDTWMTPMPTYVEGKAVFYGPYAMEATADYRGIDYKEEGCIGGVSLLSPYDIGEKAWVKIDGEWYGPLCVVDCARRGDMYPIAVYREEVIEINFDLASDVGMVSNLDAHGDYEVNSWYKDVQVLVGINPMQYFHNCFELASQNPDQHTCSPVNFKEYFLNTLEFATGWQPRVLTIEEGEVWKEYGRDKYWRKDEYQKQGEMMKITAIYVDNTDAYTSSMCGGHSGGSPRRVTITLTPEQERLLAKERADETVGMMFFDENEDE